MHNLELFKRMGGFVNALCFFRENTPHSEKYPNFANFVHWLVNQPFSVWFTWACSDLLWRPDPPLGDGAVQCSNHAQNLGKHMVPCL